MIGCAMIECLIIECLIIGCLIIGHLMILYWTDDELHTNIFEGESHGRISMIGEFIFLTKIEGMYIMSQPSMWVLVKIVYSHKFTIFQVCL